MSSGAQQGSRTASNHGVLPSFSQMAQNWKVTAFQAASASVCRARCSVSRFQTACTGIRPSSRVRQPRSAAMRHETAFQGCSAKEMGCYQQMARQMALRTALKAASGCIASERPWGSFPCARTQRATFQPARKDWNSQGRGPKNRCLQKGSCEPAPRPLLSGTSPGFRFGPLMAVCARCRISVQLLECAQIRNCALPCSVSLSSPRLAPSGCLWERSRRAAQARGNWEAHRAQVDHNRCGFLLTSPSWAEDSTGRGVGVGGHVSCHNNAWSVQRGDKLLERLSCLSGNPSIDDHIALL